MTRKNGRQNGVAPWICPASAKSMRTINPIRAIVDPIVANIQTGKERGDGKDANSLALGDPTVSGNLPPCQAALDAMVSAIQSPGHAAGYVNGCGTGEARHAIAEHHGAASPEDVIVASGCSGALELALTAMLDNGSILLVPQPGFPLYGMIAESHGAQGLPYFLKPEKQWECDLDYLRDLFATKPEMKQHVRAMVVTNPSNPTGSVYSKQHLQEIVAFCDEYRLVLLADEIYGDLTFEDNAFHPLATIAAEMGSIVPVITASGLAKQYLVPGWRVGWIVFHDNVYGSLRPVRDGARRLAQVVLGSSHLGQTVIPTLLQGSVELQEWKTQLRRQLTRQAAYLCNALGRCKGLRVVKPQGAMYFLVQLPPENDDDVAFAKGLLEEENVIVLPSTPFGVKGFFRVVFCAPESVLEEAAIRIAGYCDRHYPFFIEEQSDDEKKVAT